LETHAKNRQKEGKSGAFKAVGLKWLFVGVLEHFLRKFMRFLID